VVGPTPAELEPFNDLIRFGHIDHMYVKSEDEGENNVIVNPGHNAIQNQNIRSSQKLPIIAPRQSTTTTTTKQKSLLRPIVPKPVKLEPVQSQVVEKPVAPPPTAPAEPLGLFLGDMDCETLPDTVDGGVVDFDTLFGDLTQHFGEFGGLQMPENNNTTCTDNTTTHTNTFVNTQNIYTTPQQNTTLGKRENTFDDAVGLYLCSPLKKTKVEQDPVPINLSLEASFEPVLTTPYPAESGYMFDFEKANSVTSDYLSDEACSPLSENSVSHENGFDWEDETYGLFPEFRSLKPIQSNYPTLQ